MKWETIREHFPNQWGIMEAFDARSEGGKRIIEDVAVLDSAFEGIQMSRTYRDRLCKTLGREILFFHTKQSGIVSS